MSKRILVGVLNWGLGHATRMVPVIQALEKENFEIFIASDGLARQYLQKRFPHLNHPEAPGLVVKYARDKFLMKPKLLFQIPEWIHWYRQDLAWTRTIVKQYGISSLISDNRPGIWHGDIPSVYVTHQLRVLSGITSKFSSRLHQKLFEKFTEIWIPDYAGDFNLSGQLSHGNFSGKRASKIKYLGPFTRLKYSPQKKTMEWTIILSGPEPQRSIFEKKIADNAHLFSSNTTLIRGTTRLSSVSFPSSWNILSLAGDEEINKYILQSEKILSRSGYTSIMDYFLTGTKALLVPTPGQYEQEYLACHLQEKKLYSYLQQDRLHMLKNICFMQPESRELNNPTTFDFKILEP